MTATNSIQDRAFQKLRESRLYQTYRTAFQLSTGLSVQLVPADEDSDVPAESTSNPFCELLNRKLRCDSCRCAHRHLLSEAEQGGRSVTCFAGYRETAIPVRSGQNTVAFLRVGQVRMEGEESPAFEDLENDLPSDLSQEERERLAKSYALSRALPAEQFMGCVTLLGLFGAQLSEELNRILIAEENSEPPMVTAAKQYVNAHLEEKIVLDEVAKYVHVSPYYFCKIFKQSTGMTLTEYVNRRRVERAKRRLLNPQARVTEVAYDVGYQSLSQFNRSFLKYAGKSPTQYRTESKGAEALRAA